MGNYNSSRWHAHNKKNTVESTLRIYVQHLTKYELLPLPDGLESRTRLMAWVDGFKRHYWAQMIVSRSESPSGYSLKLLYGWAKNPIVTDVEIVATTPNFGGARYWFICPRCDRRCMVLHMAKTMGYSFWACRKCHDLVYQVCQTHSKPSYGSGDLIANLKHALNLGIEADRRRRKLNRY